MSIMNSVMSFMVLLIGVVLSMSRIKEVVDLAGLSLQPELLKVSTRSKRVQVLTSLNNNWLIALLLTMVAMEDGHPRHLLMSKIMVLQVKVLILTLLEKVPARQTLEVPRSVALNKYQLPNQVCNQL